MPDPPPAQKLVYLETLGCQMNVLDGELMVGALRRELGYEPTDDRRRAHLILFNTCSVREHAEDKVWSRLGELKPRKRRDPDVVIGVTGCMANEHREAILKRAPHVDIVCGTRDFGELPRFVREVLRSRAPVVAADLTHPVDVERDITVRGERHQAYVTVMRGCDFACTYCIVPFTRGAETSRPIDEVRREVERLCADGETEVTLLGQTVDSYGKTLDRLPGGRRPDLGDLLEAIHDTPGLLRIRFITSHPSLMREPILRRVAELPRACEYLHMPAQSGSDRVLARMRRSYTVARYREIVARARAIVPDCEVASDFIVGFPGETDEDFEATCRLVREVELGQASIFQYSPRPHTPAVGWEDDVPDDVKRERNRRLLAEQEAVQARRHAALVGRRVEVLCEGRSKNDDRKLAGRTRQNRIACFDPLPLPPGERVGVRGPHEPVPDSISRGCDDLVGKLVELEVVGSTPLTLFGRMVG